jgi:integrase
MPARPQGPWFRKGRGFFCFIEGVTHNLKTKDRSAAWDAFYALMKQTGKEVPAEERSPVSVLEVLERFGDWAEKHRKPETAAHYDQFIQSFLKAFPAASDTPAADLRPYHVQRWIDAQAKWSTTTQNKAASSVKRAYSWALEQGLIDADPIRPLKKARPKRRLRILTEAEWQTILKACPGEQVRAFFQLQRATGARPQELRAAEVRHFDPVGKCLRFPASESKGGIARVVVLTAEATRIVQDAIGDRKEGFILLNSSGDPWTRVGLRMAMRRTMKACKVHFDAYTLRHSFATDALTRGVDGLTVGVLMGHVDPSMVGKIYQHLDQKPDYLREAAERAVRPSSGEPRKAAPSKKQPASPASPSRQTKARPTKRRGK